MFKDKYKAIYDRVLPDEKLLADMLALSRESTKQRKKPNRSFRFIAVPAGALVSLLLTFALVVNLSPAFALALEHIPILRELSAIVSLPLKDTVSFSPSLSGAVENNYVQVIGQEQTVNGITMRIEYVIVDQRQLHVFYTLQSESYSDIYTTDIMLLDKNGMPFGEYMALPSRSKSGFWSGDVRKEDLRHFVVNFTDTEIPGQLILECDVYDEKESKIESCKSETTAFAAVAKFLPISTFSIPIAFDTGLVMQSEVITVDREFSFDNQGFTVSSIEILPTHTRVYITEKEHNSAWLKSLSCYLVDENGSRYDLTPYNDYFWGYGADGAELYLESVYFTESQHLTLVITDAIWLDKDAELTRIDLVSGIAANLPPGVELMGVERIANDWALAFSAQIREQKFYDPFYEDMGRWAYRLFDVDFYDEAGGSHSITFMWGTGVGYEKWRFYTEEEIELEKSWGFNTAWEYEVSGTWEYVETPGAFGRTIMLKEYPYDILYLSPYFSHISAPESPIEIIIR
jgi:hypothetical protein